MLGRGYSAGRCDAAIGAIEAQKAEGVLHLHAFLFPQMAQQYQTLNDIAMMLRKALLTVEMLKAYTSNVRRAWYPDVTKFEQERENIEAAWPAYTQERALSKPPVSMTPNYRPCQELLLKSTDGRRRERCGRRSTSDGFNMCKRI